MPHPRPFSYALLACCFVFSSAGLAAPTGKILISLQKNHAVEFYTPEGEKLGSAPTGIGPRGMAVRDGKLYVADRGLEKAAGSDVTMIDLAKMSTQRTLEVCAGCAPRAVGFDPTGVMWVSAQAHKAVYKMPAPYEEPAGSILTGMGWPTELAFFDNSSWFVIAMRSAPQVAILDSKLMRSSQLEIGPYPDHVAVRPHSKEVWFSANPMGHLGVITLGEGDKIGKPEVFRAIEFPGDLSITPDGTKVLVTGQARGELFVFDATTRRKLGFVDLGNGVAGEVVASPDSAYAAAFLSDPNDQAFLTIVELGDGTAPKLIKTFKISGQVGDILWVP